MSVSKDRGRYCLHRDGPSGLLSMRGLNSRLADDDIHDQRVGAVFQRITETLFG